MLAEQGRVEELRARTDGGDQRASRRLLDVVENQGQADELRAKADAGDQRAAYRLVDVLARLRQIRVHGHSTVSQTLDTYCDLTKTLSSHAAETIDVLLN